MALEPLLGDPPKPAFTPHWEGEARLWHSESASTTELPREIREVFKRTGHVRVRSRWAWGIFVATTIEPSPGAGHPFAYLVQEQVDELGYEDTKRMVIEVDPATELVLILLKSEDRTSTVRVRTVLPASKEPARHGQLPSQNLLPTVERHIGPTMAYHAQWYAIRDGHPFTLRQSRVRTVGSGFWRSDPEPARFCGDDGAGCQFAAVTSQEPQVTKRCQQALVGIVFEHPVLVLDKRADLLFIQHLADRQRSHIFQHKPGD